MTSPRRAALALVLGLSAGSAACAGRVPSHAELRRSALEEVAARTRVALGTDEVAAGAAERLLDAPLTDENAVRLAILRNPSVRATLGELGLSRAELVEAGLVRNPVFGADLKSFSGRPELELSLAQPFLDLFLRPLRTCVAAAELEAAEADVARDLVAMTYDVRRALSAARAADRLVELRRDALASAATARELVVRLHDAGNVTDPERTVVEAAEVRARLALLAAEAGAAEARETVAALLGTARLPKGGVAGPLRDDVGALDVADVERRAWAASLDGRAATARVAAADRGQRLAWRQGGLALFDLGVVGKREASDGAFGAGPSVDVSVPLFDHGEGRAARADATRRVREARLDGLELRVASVARRLRDRLASLVTRTTLLRETYLPLRARFVQETLQRYNAMQIGAFDALAAKQQELDAQREYVETLRRAWDARLDLEQLLAGSLPGAPVGPDDAPTPTAAPASGQGH